MCSKQSNRERGETSVRISGNEESDTNPTRGTPLDLMDKWCFQFEHNFKPALAHQGKVFHTLPFHTSVSYNFIPY